ncbi:MAG: MBL fold metallo-hydrolase [Cryobacterium sp.]|nr:MBL fold metallo-hydrolase [Cryobacterium sp.]
MDEVAVTYIGGPTILLEYAGLRILTDPTFDEPGVYPDPDGGQALVKTRGPALQPEQLGKVDLVLLSHHHHEDNLDIRGKEFLETVPLTLTTRVGANELGGNALGLAPGEGKNVGVVRVTATPALHGPAELDEVLGPVIGFRLEALDAPTAWFSGDNSSLEIVDGIVENHGQVELAIINAGAARVEEIDADLTFGSADAATAASRLGAHTVVGIHTEDWEHFSQGRASLEAAFASAGMRDWLVDTPRGTRVVIHPKPGP